jgi:hypothetical protein
MISLRHMAFSRLQTCSLLALAGLALQAPQTFARTQPTTDPNDGPCSARTSPLGDTILYFNNVLIDTLRADSTLPGPGWSSRNFAITHLAMYDAVNGILKTHAPYASSAEPPEGASIDLAAAAAGHKALVKLYPRQSQRLDALLDDFVRQFPQCRDKNLSVDYGRRVGADVLHTRNGDKSERTERYRGGTLPGEWRPTAPDFRAAVTVHWGKVTPFAINDVASFLPPPASINSLEYELAYAEVKSLGRIDSTTRTADQTEAGIFWAYDRGGLGTPVVLFSQIVQQIARDRGNTQAQNARLFALVGLSQADAGIVAWKAKYVSSLWRPVTAIQLGDQDGNPNTVGDATWTPLGAPGGAGPAFTPPFPAYVSGHSTFGGAVFKSLERFYGTDQVRFTIGSDELPGVTRTFETFSSAAAENGISRIYLGVHFGIDNSYGIAAGNLIADYVADHFLRPQAPQ